MFGRVPRRRTTDGARALRRRARPAPALLCLTVALVPAVALPTIANAAPAASSSAGKTLTVPAGQTVVIDATTRLRSLTIAEGGSLVAPEGHSLTLTVNGVETGGVIEETGGTHTVLSAGTYRGSIVLTVTQANPVTYQELTFPFRQAVYVDGTGVVEEKSVLAAVRGGTVTDERAKNIRVDSTGENFNGVYVAGGDYALTNARFCLSGNGRSDFVGYGAAITATGGSRLVVDRARIDNEGAMRAGVVADGGANVVVKNSEIHTANGELPEDYQPTVDLGYMQQAPWMLGIVGNVRATNLLGENTRATYIDSNISSEGWGVLSTDTGQNGQLTSINSTVTTTGGEGYGAYAIGNATERFLGTIFDVDTYAAINRGGSIHYGDSDAASVAELNELLDLGLSDRELRALEERNTTVESDRWGVMWHGAGDVLIDGGTVFDTERAVFLDKGQEVDITVDGSEGAELNSADGIILQVMEDDDPGPQPNPDPNGVPALLNTGVYVEPTGDPVPVATTEDLTSVHDEDAVATFTDIHLDGDFYNGLRGNNPAGPFGPGLAYKNMVLTFEDSTVSGVISASTTQHLDDEITADEYELLGQVTNTASPVVNNGVIVDLVGDSAWTVEGSSYLSSLTIGTDATIDGVDGRTVTMTVDGVATPITPGTYTGNVVLTVA